MGKKFQRKKENFICENCGNAVRGDGYTNHCPNCLWSKHVDINPGDREADCGSLMRPIGLDLKGGEYIILHECVKCGHKKKNKRSENDDMEKLIAISNKGLPK